MAQFYGYLKKDLRYQLEPMQFYLTLKYYKTSITTTILIYLEIFQY